MSAANQSHYLPISPVNRFITKMITKNKFVSWFYKFGESVDLNYFKMPSTPYDLVKDDQDLRIPLHAEQAFFQGITFQAKVSQKI